MIIDRIRPIQTDTGTGIECDIRFETLRRDAHTIFVVADAPHTLTVDPNGFLLGAFLPAWTAGERRIRIEGAVCPSLSANLSIAASLMRHWFDDLSTAPVIEGDSEYRRAGTNVGAFLSGGVDSLAMIRSLTALRPVGHPDRPVAAVVVDYQYVGGIDRDETDARFARSTATSREICADVGLDVIPVRSNFCRLNESLAFWMYRYHGSFLASMSHFLSRDFRVLHIASSYPVTHLVPWGSHPLLDPQYSSQHVRISHHGAEWSRLQKIRQLRDWAPALNRMYVCTSDTSNGRNCGACEKCVRTKLHLLIEGRLADAGAFEQDDVREADIRAIRIKTEYARLCYEEALPGLERLGRTDLVEAVGSAIRDYQRRQSPVGGSRAGSGLLRRAVRKLKRSIGG
jgi:hypothetical protein